MWSRMFTFVSCLGTRTIFMILNILFAWKSSDMCLWFEWYALVFIRICEINCILMYELALFSRIYFAPDTNIMQNSDAQRLSHIWMHCVFFWLMEFYWIRKFFSRFVVVCVAVVRSIHLGVVWSIQWHMLFFRISHSFVFSKHCVAFERINAQSTNLWDRKRSKNSHHHIIFNVPFLFYR